MTLKQCLLICGILFFFSKHSSAQQPWSGVLDPSRAADWSAAGVPGGVPSASWTQCGSTIAAYSGSATTINNALNACPANQFVKLGPGIFQLSTGILFGNKSNVVLRGSGADQTHIVFTGSDGCGGLHGAICFHNAGGDLSSGSTASWTGGFAKGSQTLTFSSTSGMAVGMYITLDQLNDANTDTGNVWICDSGDVCVDEGPSGGQLPNRGQQQMVKITGISGNTVTTSTPILMPNWRADRSPLAHFYPTYISRSGVEDLSFDWTNSNAQSGIALFNAGECWVRGVRSITLANPNAGGRNHVWIRGSAFITVRDSYFYGSMRALSTSYGIEWYDGSSNSLIENNFFQHESAPFVFNGGGAGSVVAYNYAIDNYWLVSTTSIAGMTWMHGTSGDMILHEGNVGQGWWADDIHGTHFFDTLFRNYYEGSEPADSKRTDQRMPVSFRAYSRYMNVIGNALGTPGVQNTYQCAFTSAPPSCPGTIVFELGQPNNLPIVNSGDAKVATTLMRWGNYDTVSGAAKWNSTEVPSGIGLYANAVPASQTLPSSFYLSGKPAWFGSMAWPAIGPDVSNGTVSGLGGHVNIVPAQSCYSTSPIDSSYGSSNVRLFNASKCYGQGGGGTTPPPPQPPNPPTNVTTLVK
jgi:hypothetical protein